MLKPYQTKMSDFVGIFIILALVFNLWFVAFLFYKLPFKETYSAIITCDFWKWYMFWIVLAPYEYYQYKNTLDSNPDNNIV